MIRAKDISLIGLLAAIIAISGSLKIPGPFPGTEFQLSAPLAIAIAASFGFKRYLLAGIAASTITLILGTHTIINVIVAMTFRIIAGGIIALFGSGFLPVVLAGPLGSLAGRLVLFVFLGEAIGAMIIAALPGMVYTAIASWPLSRLLIRIKRVTPWKEDCFARKNL